MSDKKYRWLILVGILIVCLFMYNGQLARQDAARVEMIKSQIETLKADMEENIDFDEPYTMIINYSAVFYKNKLAIPPDDMLQAIRWVDVNEVPGFSIDKGNTHYDFVEGHIQGKQLVLYAPYYYSEYDFEGVQNIEEITDGGN